MDKRYVVNSTTPNRIRVYLPDNIADVFEGMLLSAQFMWNSYEREIARKTLDALALQFGIEVVDRRDEGRASIIEQDGSSWSH